MCQVSVVGNRKTNMTWILISRGLLLSRRQRAVYKLLRYKTECDCAIKKLKTKFSGSLRLWLQMSS